MLEEIAAALTDYAHRRGGQPVPLTDPGIAAEVAAAVLEAVTVPPPPAPENPPPA